MYSVDRRVRKTCPRCGCAQKVQGRCVVCGLPVGTRRVEAVDTEGLSFRYNVNAVGRRDRYVISSERC